MLRAVIFDMGGTLDGDAEHWLDRFDRLYAACGHPVPRPVLREAYDDAGRRAREDEAIQSMGLEAMVGRLLDWQFAHMGLEDAPLKARIVSAFDQQVRPAAAANRTLLKQLFERGLTLGVVSNACGNVPVLCEDYGFAPFLTVTIDSRRVGVEKPDPAIFRLALERLERPADQVLMVGDSYDRDILPSASLGMHTAWLRTPADAATAGELPYRPDIEIARLSDLLAAIDARERALA
jgi:HAD superfamily hydrolase (TIGR01549 family)